MPETLFNSDLKSLPLFARGKVRDIYGVGEDHLLIVVTDRMSAFDVVLPTAIQGKGAVLTAISNFWFERTGDLIPLAVGGGQRKPVEKDARGGQISGLISPQPVEALIDRVGPLKADKGSGLEQAADSGPSVEFKRFAFADAAPVRLGGKGLNADLGAKLRRIESKPAALTLFQDREHLSRARRIRDLRRGTGGARGYGIAAEGLPIGQLLGMKRLEMISKRPLLEHRQSRQILQPEDFARRYPARSKLFPVEGREGSRHPDKPLEAIPLLCRHDMQRHEFLFDQLIEQPLCPCRRRFQAPA